MPDGDLRTHGTRRYAIARALTVGLVAMSAAGCSFGGADFAPQGADAVSARESAFVVLDEALDSATGADQTLGTARFDLCSRGQKNWKVQDEHAWECVAARSAVTVVAIDRTDVARALTDTQVRASALGCSGTYARNEIGSIAEEYWAPQADTPTYSAGQLPSALYRCRDDLTLEVRPTSAEDRPELALRAETGLTRGIEIQTVTAEPFEERVVDAVSAGTAALLLVLTVSRMYYAVDF